MSDVHNAKTRSRNMAAIKGCNTRPECYLRSLLHRAGFRFRLHGRDLPGKPDLILPRYKLIIFMHGCFWHMHDCHLFRLPATRTQWWYDKLSGNRLRDLCNEDKLRELGWRVLVVWECAVRGRRRLSEQKLLLQVCQIIHGGESFTEIKALRC